MSTKPVWTNDQITAQLLRDGYQWQRAVDFQFSPSGAFNATEKAATELAFQYVGDVINLKFVETAYTSSLDGHITFSNVSMGAGLWGNTDWTYYTNKVNNEFPMSHAEVEINSDYTGVTSTYKFGTYDFMSLYHEIGHSLGLDHPGNYGEGAANYNADALYFQDSRQYTNMSYFDATNTGGNHEGYFASTPLLDDVMALQALYGANMTTRTGDTVYGFNNTSGRDAFDFTIDKHPIVAIWDAGGTDTIDLSGYSMGNNLDLNAGDFSDIDGMLKNLAVCLNVTIENGIGGSGDDTITGNSANNVLTGNDGNDTLISGTGSDTLNGGNGDDVLNFGANFDATDLAFGGAGTDTLELNGNYSNLVIGASALSSIEAVKVDAGHNYNLTFADVASGTTITVDGSGLSSGDTLTVDGVTVMGSSLTITGGSGTDNFTGGLGDDTFNFSAGFRATDTVNGGGGNDTLVLSGDFGSLVFAPTTMAEVQNIVVGAGHSYNLTTNDANVAAGAVLNVDASALGAANTLTFNGGAETNGGFNVTGGAGADSLTGGSGNDTLNGGAGNNSLNGGAGDDTLIAGSGTDSLTGGSGNDTFTMGANLTAADTVNGGAGNDTVVLNGNYALTLGATSLSGVETMVLTAGHDYALTFNDANVAAGNWFTIDGSKLGNGDNMTIDVSADSDGHFSITGGNGNDTFKGSVLTDYLYGGGGNDTLTGGAGPDKLQGGAGADSMNGGAGADTFVYGKASDSTGLGHDTITGFDFTSDLFDLSGTISGIDAAITKGTLSDASFDANLDKIVGKHMLGAHHALLVTPNAGGDAGQEYLVVDLNGKSGYQAGKDLVIHLDSAAHISSLDIGDFI